MVSAFCHGSKLTHLIEFNRMLMDAGSEPLSPYSLLQCT